MWLVLDQFSRTLIDAAVANAILLSVVVVLVVFTRQPARRIVVAQTGVYAALLMIPLVAFDAFPRLYPIDWLLRAGVVPPHLTPELTPMDFDSAGRQVPRGRSDSSTLVEWPAGERLVRLAVLIYLGGVVIGLAWFGLGVWGFRRLLDRSLEVSPSTRRVFEELMLDLGRSPPHPTLRASDWLRSPVLGGVARPTIVIPGRLDRDEVDPDALRLILLHELAHADRGDAWFNVLAALAQIFWFFLPHPWWLRTQLRIDQEFLADRRAAGPLGETTRYARWLVGLSNGRPTAVSGSDDDLIESDRPWNAGTFDTPLLQRVAMLLYCPFPVEGHPPGWFSMGVRGAFMLFAVTLSMVRILAPVDASAFVPMQRAGDPISRDFALEEFDIAPDEDGRSVVGFPLKLALPPAYRLLAEIKASPRTLAQLRIAGCPLGIPSTPEDKLPDSPVSWHKVEIHRRFGTFIVRIDNREFEPDPKAVDNTAWLTFAPGDQPVTVRSLQITW